MALVNCPECGKQVSDSAMACPNCGYAIKEHFEKIEHEKKENARREQAEKDRILKEQKKKEIIEKIKSNKPAIIVAAVAVIILCFVAIVFNAVVLNPKRNSEKLRADIENEFLDGDFDTAYGLLEDNGIFEDQYVERLATCADNSEQLNRIFEYTSKLTDASKYNDLINAELLKEAYYVGDFVYVRKYYLALSDRSAELTKLDSEAELFRHIQGRWICEAVKYPGHDKVNLLALYISGRHAYLYHSALGDKFIKVAEADLTVQQEEETYAVFKAGNYSYDIFEGRYGRLVVRNVSDPELKYDFRIGMYWSDFASGDDGWELDYKDFETIEIPSIGMTALEVRRSTWGEPQKINIDTYAWGTSEQWVYSNNKYIYLENGIVVAIQDHN